MLVRVNLISALLAAASIPVAGLNAAPTAPAPTATSDDLTVCEALMTEMDIIGKKTEKEMIAMGDRLAKEEMKQVAETQAYNATQSATGMLNWVAPGLGTALDLINQSALKSLKQTTRTEAAKRAGAGAGDPHNSAGT